jgi:hypothetical protein
MEFEPGKFYMHDKGRKVAILGKVSSYRWGDMLVVEEVDRTGHSISCSEIGQEANDNNWIEIGEQEFLREFGGQVQ